MPIVGIVTRLLLAGWSRVWLLAGTRNFSLLITAQTSSVGPTQPLMHWVPGTLKLPAHLHLVLKLRMRGAIPTLALYALMASLETTLPCPVLNYFHCSVILFCCAGYCSDAVLNVMWQ